MKEYTITNKGYFKAIFLSIFLPLIIFCRIIPDFLEEGRSLKENIIDYLLEMGIIDKKEYAKCYHKMKFVKGSTNNISCATLYKCLICGKERFNFFDLP